MPGAQAGVEYKQFRLRRASVELNPVFATPLMMDDHVYGEEAWGGGSGLVGGRGSWGRGGGQFTSGVNQCGGPHAGRHAKPTGRGLRLCLKATPGWKRC